MMRIAEDECFNNATRCTFDVVNGSCLATMGILGFIMSSTLIYFLALDIIKIPGSKKIFMINVSLNDALLGIVGTLRGLGIIFPEAVGAHQDGSFNPFCTVFLIIATFVWRSIILTLLPLTIDRFIAVIFSTKYKFWITRRVRLVMVILSWTPAILTHLIYDVINVSTSTQVEYLPSYNRCHYIRDRPFLPIFTLLVPLIVIIMLYSIMLLFIIRNKIPMGRLLVTTSAIIATGVATVIPEVLMFTFDLSWSYKAAQLLTITLYHANCIYNPIIYFIANPRVSPQLKEQASLKGSQMRKAFKNASFQSTSIN